MFLPDEIINLILSYREINPVSLLIRESVDSYNNTERWEKKFHCYYFHVLMKYKTLQNKNKTHLLLCEEEKVQEKWDKQINVTKKNRDLFRLEANRIDTSMFLPTESYEFNNYFIGYMNEFETQLEILREKKWEEAHVIRDKINDLTHNFKDFVYDLNHSIVCTGIINRGYMLKTFYMKSLIDDNYNKYRNEIYCESKRQNRVNYTKSKNVKLYYPHLLKTKR